MALRIEQEQAMAKLPDLSIRILQIVRQHGRASISDIHAITQTNRNTIKVRLRELVGNTYLVKEGIGLKTSAIQLTGTGWCLRPWFSRTHRSNFGITTFLPRLLAW